VKVIFTIVLAILVALFFSSVLLLFGTASGNAAVPVKEQTSGPVNQVEVLAQMSSATASSATIAKESKTLNAITNTAAKSGGSLTEQQKLDTLSIMSASQ
jgi:hypothetical protein